MYLTIMHIINMTKVFVYFSNLSRKCCDWNRGGILIAGRAVIRIVALPAEKGGR